MLLSIAVVTTDASARYGKQLLSHLGHKVRVGIVMRVCSETDQHSARCGPSVSATTGPPGRP